MEACAGDRSELQVLYEEAVRQTEAIESRLKENMSTTVSESDQGARATVHFQSNWPRKDFEAAVGRVKEYISAGDCYQAVIAQQFTKPTSADPLAIYRALRATNPQILLTVQSSASNNYSKITSISAIAVQLQRGT